MSEFVQGIVLGAAVATLSASATVWYVMNQVIKDIKKRKERIDDDTERMKER